MYTDQSGRLEEFSIRSVAKPVLDALGKAVRSPSSEALIEIVELLQTLPITSEEFALASSRIRNARRYLAEQEVAASRWEIRTLTQQIHRLSDAEAYNGRSRNRSGR